MIRQGSAGRFKRLVQDRKGASAVEFAIIVTLLLVMVFAIMEFAVALWQWNTAETTTQLGARLAVQSDPVATGFASYSGTDAGFNAGTNLTQAVLPSFSVTCTSSGCTSSGEPSDFDGGGFDSDAFAAIVAEMQKLMPQVQAENVAIEYSHVGLGFAGRPGTDLVPAVSVRLTGLMFNFIVLDSIIALMNTVVLGGTGDTLAAGIPMPAFTATLTGEDLNTGWSSS